jgi:hypothetical protein
MGLTALTPDSNLTALLLQLARTKTPVKLLNIYKGIPISNDALIDLVDANGVQITTQRYQISCLYLTHETYILSGYLPSVLHADVTRLNAAAMKAVLANFQPAQPTIGLRSQVRVEPEAPVVVQVQVKNSSTHIPASLLDLSADGLGLLLDRHLFHPHVFQAGTELDATFTLDVQINAPARVTQPLAGPSALENRYSRDAIRGLSGGGGSSNSGKTQSLPPSPRNTNKVSVHGRIIKVRPDSQAGGIRLGVRLVVDETTHMVMTQYISKRQTELIREINSLYEGLCRLNNGSPA